MMMSKKNKASMIIASLPKKAMEVSMPEMEMEVDPQEVAAEELMSAITAKDPKALKEALKSFMSLCEDEDEEDESEEDASEMYSEAE